ncbi:MAG: hemolysin family protein [Chlamydiae bacterium]|nr:hemolysin family protein [Chlamydiota bacterium]
MPHYIEKILYCLFFLICASIVSGLQFSLQRLGKMQTKEELKKQGFTYFPKLLKFFVSGHEWDALWYALNFSKLIFYLIFGLSFFFFSFSVDALKDKTLSLDTLLISSSLPEFFLKSFITVFITLIADFLVQFLCARKPRFWFKVLSIPSSILLTLTLPLTLGFLKITAAFFPKKTHFIPSPSFRVQDKILEWLHDSEVESLLEKNEKKLIYAVISFKDRIAREVMVPRINVFSIPVDATIAQAANCFLEEGYSRIPVYENNVDSIIGVLLYKDVLNLLITNKGNLSVLDTKTIQTLVKPVVYTPETKKISVLLQEFRSKQIHLGIVVDEYGGTEGIVTIEDILEELVGEIEDEYDVQQTQMFSTVATGGWIIEAKMNIIDVEEELGIKIPTSPEYDTIGGYIFHKAGSIPSKGWKIHHDEFDLEVLSSDERSINKIKITPHSSSKEH